MNDKKILRVGVRKIFQPRDTNKMGNNIGVLDLIMDTVRNNLFIYLLNEKKRYM